MKLFSTPPHVKRSLIVIIFSMMIFFNNSISFAQSGQKWSAGGNSIDASVEFIGTNNDAPMIFKTNGIEGMRLKTNGYLGIGTNAPEEKLDVNGNAWIRGTLKVGNSILFDGINDVISTTTGHIDFGSTNIITTGTINATEIYVSGQTEFVNLKVENQINLGSKLAFTQNQGSISSQGKLYLQNELTSENTILNLSSGNVGIGINNPIEKLDVNGNANIRGTLYVYEGVIIGEKVNSNIVKSEELISEIATIEEIKGREIISEKILSELLEVEEIIKIGNTLNIDGLNSRITSVSGLISFDNTKLKTLGSITAGSIISNFIKTDNIDLDLSETSSNDFSLVVSETDGTLSTTSFPELLNSLHYLDGKLGIGTDNPQKKLHVKTFNSSSIIIPGLENQEYGGTVRIENQVENGSISIWDLEPIANTHPNFPNKFRIGTPDNPVITLVDNGNVGIGTIVPSAKLHVAGNVKIDNLADGNTIRMVVADEDGNLGTKEIPGCDAITCDGGKVSIGTSSVGPANLKVKSDNNFEAAKILNLINSENRELSYIVNNCNNGYNPMGNANDFAIIWSDKQGEYAKNGTAGLLIAPHSSAASGIIISAEGNVGIGTSPTEKLTVKGTINVNDNVMIYDDGSIWAKEIKVKPENPYTADFVFEKDYNLISLSEVEKYIKENKHLPDVPSAKEIETEGTDLQRMSGILLQKIEELTLYVIELKKENDAIKKQLNLLQNK